MPFITFIYKQRFNIDGDMPPYFGKYCTNCIHDDLYMEVKTCLIQTLNDYIIKRGRGFRETEKTVFLGVLSISYDDTVTINSNNNEIQCFHFYRDYLNGNNLI